MNKKTLKLIGAVLGLLLVVSLCAAPAAAADDSHHKSLSEILSIIKDKISDWSGWTFDKSTYTLYSSEWVNDMKTNIRAIITDRSKSFNDRAKAQAYALGWDDRFDYVEKYGTVNEDTGAITYDIPFWDSMFGGLKFREKWFTNIADYNAAMSIYMDNYNSAVQSVPREV